MITDIHKRENGLVDLTFVPCPQCHQQHKLTVRQDELEDYYASGDVAKSFPNLLAPQRELFMTAIGAECWKEVFSGEEY